MPREEFRQALDALRDEVVHMANVVSTRLRKVVTALETEDRRLAARIADSDDDINELYLDLERDCIDLFALQQPVAGDLRFIAASFKIITDLERVADLAANLAGYIVDAEFAEFDSIGLQDLVSTTVGMLDDATAAYADGDTAMCYDVADRDDDLDTRCERVVQRVVRDLADSRPDPETLESRLETVTDVLLTVRDTERIGDHAVNIAARTLYMVENDDALIY
jgi:phosphate transport system protein